MKIMKSQVTCLLGYWFDERVGDETQAQRCQVTLSCVAVDVCFQTLGFTICSCICLFGYVVDD